jgi:secreted Zn-dependent insulinase-like peptidase
MGRKLLNRTLEERTQQKRDWEAQNPEKVAIHRRTALLNLCIRRGSMPCKKTVDRYEFTREELMPILDTLFEKQREIEDSE